MPVPPPKPPSKPRAPAARPGAGPAKPPLGAEDAVQRTRREKEELEKETSAVEEEMEALKAKYDQYFLGLERREPARWREELKKKVLRLKGAFTRNTGLKFRVQSLHARFLSYERLWLRSAREREEGTYRRDLFKARLRAHHDEEPAAPPPPAQEAARPAVPAPVPAAAAKAGKAPPAANPGAPAQAPLPQPAAPKAPPPAAKAPAPPPPPRPPAAVAPPGGMSETQMRALYNAYLAAKMTCREDVSKLTYDAVARSVSKQIPELISRYKAKSVEFKVEVKEGKAVLKAIPKV